MTEVIKIRLDSRVKKKLEEMAEREQRTLAGQIRLALDQWIKNRHVLCQEVGPKK